MAKQSLLFEEDYNQQNVANTLPILKASGVNKKIETPYDKEVTKYNKLLAKIADLENYLQKCKDDAESRKTLYATHVIPAIKSIAQQYCDNLKKLHALVEQLTLTKAKKRDIYNFLSEYGEEYDRYHAELETLHKEYTSMYVSLLNKKDKQEINEALDNYKSYSNNDEDDDDGNHEKYYEENENFRKRAQQKQQQQKEQALKEKHATDLTTINTAELYKTLAKQLHPDLEQNETIKEHKVKLMQQLSEAKINKDLMAMLRVQAQAKDYITQDELEKTFSLEKLKTYNKMLTKQKVKIEQEVQPYRDALMKTYNHNKIKGITKDDHINEALHQATADLKKVKKSVSKVTTPTDAYEFIEDFFYNMELW